VCITRVGRVTSVSKGQAVVRFFDGRELDEIDVSVVRGAKVGSFVEVFGNMALSLLSSAEARRRREAWDEVMRAAALPLAKGRGGG
jgi:hydrogenase maturation factor